MATIADLVIKLSADTKDADKDIGSFSGKVSKGFGKALLPAVGVLGGLAIGAKKAGDAAKNLGESQNAVNVVFGKSAEKIHKFAKVADKEAGLSMRALNELVTPIGSMLQNVGFSSDKAATSSVNLAKRAADMASVFNVDVKEALAAIQAGLRGEADPLERFGVGLSASAVEAQALAMGLVKAKVDTEKLMTAQLAVTKAHAKAGEAMKEHGKNSAEYAEASVLADIAERKLAKTLEGKVPPLDANQKATAGLALIMEQTNKLQGDFVNTSGGAANAARINAASQENLQAKLGKGVLPVMEMYQKMLGRVTVFMSEHTGAVKVAALVIGGLAVGVIAVNGAMAVYRAGAIAAAAATRIWNTAAALLNGTMRLNPIALVVTAIAALVAGTIIAYQKSETFRKVVDGLFGALKDVVGFVKTHWGTISTIIKNSPFVLSLRLAKLYVEKIVGAVQWLIDNLGRIKFPKIPGGGLIDKIPGFAGGVRNFGGGLAMVGEGGPELVNLPRGSDVFSNAESRNMLQGGGPALNVENLTVNEPVDVELLAARVSQRLALR